MIMLLISPKLLTKIHVATTIRVWDLAIHFNYLTTEFIHSERYNLPSIRNYLSIRLYFHIAVYLSIWHHHVGFTCIVTIGIWNPYVVNIFTFYVKSTV